MKVVLKCRPDNDLFRVLAAAGYDLARYDSLATALDMAPSRAALLLLADDYPRPGERIDDALLAVARDKGLRLYIEYPASLPGLELGQPRPTRWERAIVASDWFAPTLPQCALLALHGCWFLPVKATSPHLLLGRVAGYRRAAYGVPAEAFPILFELPGQDVLVAVSKLSQFVTARYGPTVDWKRLWERLLRWLMRSDDAPELTWQPTVGIQAGRMATLPDNAEANAFHRSVHWFRENVVCSIDWKKAALEGFESSIDCQGRQFPRAVLRGDCTAETALVLACDWALAGDPVSRHLAAEIMDYVFSAPDFRQSDPHSPAYGLNNWYERAPIFYGDDNARVILPALAVGRLLDDGRWDEHILRCLLANLRTTGRLGFRRNRIDLADFPAGSDGWRFFQSEEVVSYAPHYQAYLWAAFLWAYALTGYEGFLRKTENAIRLTMAAYPQRWRWTNGITQEMARMLLPLAFLVRIEGTAEQRGWLQRVAVDLLAQMQPCGAIREKIGELAMGRYPPPRSNETYGSNEASLIQENGDPACDLLYTANYAFLGLHEAAAAAGDAPLREAEDRLADLLCRIQVRSSAHPYLDGAWMRSFDDELWEYWGSSADQGWGAWCVESGWTNAWIASVLAFRQRGETLFDLRTADRLRAHIPKLLEEMGLL